MFLPPLALIVAAALDAHPVPLPRLHETPVSARAESPESLEWAPPAPSLAEGDLFTLLDYFEAGQQRALRYLGRLEPAARQRFELSGVSAACVRVSCERDSGRSVVFSTGVVVAGGRRVVTAGHGIGEANEPGMKLSVALADGREIEARVASRSPVNSTDQDWAVLDLVGPLPANMVSVSVGAARPGALAFIMGYPERVGLAADGHATASLSGRPEALNPLLFVARAPLSADTGFEPLAGAVPLSGASGSPVFDEQGNLVGVLVAIGRLAYPDGVRHVYRVSLSGDFEAALKS